MNQKSYDKAVTALMIILLFACAIFFGVAQIGMKYAGG